MVTSTVDRADSKQDSIRKVAFASAIGTTIEWYDFLIYATAASLVLNKLFFPTDSALVSQLLSISTIGVGFFARPIGAIILSHYGDRVGRKSLLVFTLIAMGISTMLIGILPTYASIGIAAPIILVLCRLIQGLAVGGEWGGAVLMAIEHAPPEKRGFYGSVVQIGFPLGMALGTLSFFALAFLDNEQFMSWGWRIPFLASALLVIVGTVVRLHIHETPDFEKSVRSGEITRFPVWQAIRQHPKDIIIGLGARITEISWIYVLTIFGLSYAVNSLGMPRSLILGAIALGAIVELVTIPLCGALSDYIGRRPVYILGCVAAIILAFPIFWGIETRDPTTVILSFVVGMAVGHGVMYGVQASFLSEMFPTNLRYSGSSLGYQLAAPLGGGIIPVVATALVGATDGAIWPVSILMIVIGLITIAAVLWSKETAYRKVQGISGASTGLSGRPRSGSV